MQHGKGEVNGYTDLPQIIKKIPNKQSNFTPKETRKRIFFLKKSTKLVEKGK